MKKISLILNLLIFIALTAFGILHFVIEYDFLKPLFILTASLGFGVLLFYNLNWINKIDIIFFILILFITIQKILLKQTDLFPIIILVSTFSIYKLFTAVIYQNKYDQVLIFANISAILVEIFFFSKTFLYFSFQIIVFFLFFCHHKLHLSFLVCLAKANREHIKLFRQ